jgi:hypothetical protein
MVDSLQEYPGALTPSNEVSERATASALRSPERKDAPPRTGGYRNDGWLPNPTTHATLTGRCLKSEDTWPSPSGGRARSAYIDPVCLRLGIFLLTLGQKQINSHSRWEALHGAGASAPYTRTNGTPASPSPQPLLSPGRDRKPDARRAGAPTPPHLSSSRQLLPQPSTPPQGLPPSLTVSRTQPGMLSALLRPFTPASAEATGISIVASESDSNHTPLSSRDRHAKTNNTQSGSRPQLKGAPMRYPFVHWENSILAAATRVRLQRKGSPKASARGSAASGSDIFRTSVKQNQKTKSEHRRRGWGLTRPLRKVGHLT